MLTGVLCYVYSVASAYAGNIFTACKLMKQKFLNRQKVATYASHAHIQQVSSIHSYGYYNILHFYLINSIGLYFLNWIMAKYLFVFCWSLVYPFETRPFDFIGFQPCSITWPFVLKDSMQRNYMTDKYLIEA